jgi:hypothetical protein
MSFSPFNWVRDALGIRKDWIDAKKSKLEVRRLQDEERARTFITPATLADIKQFDPHYQEIEDNIHIQAEYHFFSLSDPDPKPASRTVRWRYWLFMCGSLFLLGIVMYCIVRYILNHF